MFVIICPCRRTHSRKSKCSNRIPGDSMPLINSLGLLFTPIQIWRKVLRKANKRLQEQRNVEYEAEDGVRGGEVVVAGAALVDLDDDEACEKGGDA